MQCTRRAGYGRVMVARNVECDAAHQVLGDGGSCACLLGRGHPLDGVVEAADLDALGMLLALGEIRRLAEQRLVGTWDHAALFRCDVPLLPAI